MAQLLSQPTIVVVQPPSRFASGADRGSFAAGVWTPGRDASGVVNKVSWDLVPSGQWSSVADSSIINLDTVVKAALPSWRDYGTGGPTWDNYVMVWNGAAADPANARMWFFGGGHSDSSNNGLYRFDAYKMAWAIECLPSDTNAWSAGYKAKSNGSSFTGCDESTAVTHSKRLAGTLLPANDHGYDELFWDGKPTARHTYNGMVYASDRGEVVLACRRLWTYNIASGTWNYKRAFQDNLLSLDAPNTGVHLIAEHTFSAYDEATGDVLMSSYGSAGSDDVAAFNLRTKTWGAYSPAPAGHWPLGGMVRYGRNVTYLRVAATGTGGNYYVVHNLDTRTATTVGTSFLGTGLGNFQNDAEMPALIYVPSINRYWLCAAHITSGMSWYEVNPTTTPWTITPKTFTGDVPIPTQEPSSKHMYIPSMNAIVFFHRGGTGATGRMYVYKF